MEVCGVGMGEEHEPSGIDQGREFVLRVLTHNPMLLANSVSLSTEYACQ
jgi:hypothetical protein